MTATTPVAAFDNQTPLLAAKLFIPQARHGIVPRQRLMTRLSACLHQPLTLVAAPAGFGKTTLVSTWLHGLRQPVAWLSLDDGDNDPTRFLRYLLAALQQVAPAVGQDVAAALAAANPPLLPAAIAAFSNDLMTTSTAVLLVLDDFHVIDAAPIQDAIAALVAHQPPQLHLLLLTREDPQLPLARLRARGELVELRAQDLRFAPEETSAFLQDVMGLDLDAPAIAALDAQIEGWVAGLQLAALSLQHRANPAQLIANLSGSHHFILSYLTTEVLRQLTPAQKTFLLETSVLTRLCGDLCDAVTGRSGSGALLEELYRSNVFVIPLDDEHRWYRYHHLFADLLRRQLQQAQPAQASVLCQRASAWYEAEGAAVEAVEYALAALDHPRAVRLLEMYARAVVLQGYAQTVENWLHRLPAEWRQAGPRANLAFGWSLLLRGQLGAIEPYLSTAEAVAANDAAATVIQAEALALRAGLVSLRGDPVRGCTLAREAMQLAPAEDLYVRSMTTFCLGTACNYAGRDGEAIATYLEALPLCQAAGNQVAAMLIVGNLTMLYSARGQLHTAADLCLTTLATAAQAGLQNSPTLAAVYGGYADLLYAWNDLPGAQNQVAQALTLARRGGHIAAIVYGCVVQSRVHQAAGDMTAAAQALAEALQLQRLGGMPAWVGTQLTAQQVALALEQHDLATARQVLAQSGVSADDPTNCTQEIIHLAHLRYLLEQGRMGDGRALERAHRLAQRIMASAAPAQRAGRVLETHLLRAQVNQAQGNPAAACDELALALAAGEQGGYVRLFVNVGEPLRALLNAVRRRLLQHPVPGDPSLTYVDQVFAAFPGPSTAGASSPAAAGGRTLAGAPLVEPLTEREVEVLRLMAQGLTYEEVAQRLIVSLNTVRYHVKGLYGKLGVDKRLAAIEQARVLGLL